MTKRHAPLSHRLCAGNRPIAIDEGAGGGEAASWPPRWSGSTKELDRWGEVPAAALRTRVLGELVADSVLGSGHPLEHALKASAVCAEREEHEAVLSDATECSRAAEDLELVALYVFDHHS